MKGSIEIIYPSDRVQFDGLNVVKLRLNKQDIDLSILREKLEDVVRCIGSTFQCSGEVDIKKYS